MLQLLTLLFIQFANSFITHDSGIITPISNTHSSFVCQNGFSTSETIQFSEAFEKIPEVILVLEELDIDLSESQFMLRKDVTTKDFTIYIECPTNQVSLLTYHWYAIDDRRVKVIDKFNVVDYSTQTFTHNYTRLSFGFISLTQIGIVGLFQFEINISQITSSSVTIEITIPYQKIYNLINLGYQIILTTPGALTIESIQQTADTYESQEIPIKINSWFMTPTSALRVLQYGNARFKFNQIAADPIVYERLNWSGSYVPDTHRQIWLRYEFNASPQICKSTRVSQKYDPLINEEIPFSFFIQETNMLFYNFGTHNILVDKNFQALNIVISVHCNSGIKIISTFDQCPGCAQSKIKSQTHNCLPQNNVITYYPKCLQQSRVTQELIVIISESRLALSQLSFENEQETYIPLIEIIIRQV